MQPMTTLAIDERRPAPRNGTRPSPAQRRDMAVGDLKDSLRELLRSALRATTGIALDHVEDLAGVFERTAAAGGMTVGGLLGGIRAGMSGRNPLWGALKGAVGALSPAMRVALVAVLLLAILLLPITVVLVLVALIVLVVVAAATAGS